MLKWYKQKITSYQFEEIMSFGQLSANGLNSLLAFFRLRHLEVRITKLRRFVRSENKRNLIKVFKSDEFVRDGKVLAIVPRYFALGWPTFHQKLLLMMHTFACPFGTWYLLVVKMLTRPIKLSYHKATAHTSIFEQLLIQISQASCLKSDYTWNIYYQVMI